jgi:hypothetical protein
MADGGAADLYASDHIYTEVYRRLPRIASFSPVPLHALRARFEAEYLPALRFVTVDARDIADPQVLAITDPDDVPTGLLAKLVGSCIVFSEDRHLRRPGLAPDDWRLVAEFAVDLLEAAQKRKQASGMATVAMTPAQGTVALINFISRRTGLSPWLVGGVAAAGIALVLKEPARRQAVVKYVKPLIEVPMLQIQAAATQEQRGLQGLRKVMLPAPVTPTPKQQVAIVLARQQQPLLAREIQERMLRYFPRDLVPTVGEVRTLLQEGSEFVQPERYRWQFGRKAGAWKG